MADVNERDRSAAWDGEGITFRFAESRGKMRPPLLPLILLPLFIVTLGTIHVGSSVPLSALLKALFSPYVLFLIVPPVVLGALVYGLVCLIARVINPFWSLTLLSDSLVLHRVWTGDTVVPYEKIIALEVGYANGAYGYDSLKMDIRLRDGTLSTTHKCRVRGETVEAAASAVRKRLRSMGILAGSREEDRNLRREKARKALLPANILVTVVTAGFLFMGCYQACAQYRWSKLLRHGALAVGRIVGEPRFKNKIVEIGFVFTPPDGRPRTGNASMTQPWVFAPVEGGAIEVRYIESDPDVFHPVGARVGLGVGGFVFPGIWLVAAAFWYVPMVRGKHPAYCRRRFYLLGKGELEEERLVDYDLAKTFQ